MEEVLNLYQKPYNATKPVVCMDEMSKQLLSELVSGLPSRPGSVAKKDSEYKREGTANTFLAFEPLTGRCVTQVTERRTKKDWAHFIKELLDKHYPTEDEVILVVDNLNTHHKSALYENFSAPEASRLAGRLRLQYTPVHGSWLNMAEIGFSMLSREALKKRIPSIELFSDQVAAWTNERNRKGAPINWRFTANDAQIKLRRLYPNI